MAALPELDWLFALGTLFFLLSAWGIGANDIANSYCTSVSSRSLTLIQAGILATMTEFFGAVALGQRVTSTIRSGVFSVERFNKSPGVLILAMVVTEFGSSVWLVAATRLGYPVSTTQSVVGALVGVGLASSIAVNWGWQPSSVSQIAASWIVSPLISGIFGAIIMGSIRFFVHNRKDPLTAALWAIPFYYALTAAVLALFLVIDGGHGTIQSLEEMGAGKACGIILGVFFGVLGISAGFFLPYAWRKFVKEDRRLRWRHIPCGPLLWRENYKLYWPGDPNKAIVPDYYESEYRPEMEEQETELKNIAVADIVVASSSSSVAPPPRDGDAERTTAQDSRSLTTTESAGSEKDIQREAELKKLDELPWAHPRRIWGTFKFLFTYGITRDVVTHQSAGLESIHDRAPRFDNKVEHLWTTAQVCSAMIMSIAHGANDISNAIGPFTTEYFTWKTGVASATTDTPMWIKVVGGLVLGVGFWTYGYHIMRNLGNKITKHTPTRGYSMELATAVTVLMAARLGLPVSSTQCVTGAIVGVAMVNGDVRSVNWRQLGKIFSGWVLTLPAAGLLSGLVMAMALNAPHWTE